MARSIDWFDGARTIAVPTRWLRMECPCDQCRVAQTSERRWLPGEPIEFQPVSVDSSDAGIRIVWASGHTTVVSSEQLTASLATRDRARSQAVLWDRGGEPDRFDHDTALADPVTQLRFLETFRDQGVAILSGTPAVPGQLEATMASLRLQMRETFNERIHDVRVDPHGYNIAHTAEGLPPHSDYPSYTHPPSGQVLHMLVNDCDGGDSLVVDGWAAVQSLRTSAPEHFEALVSVAIGFRQYASDRESFARAPLLSLTPAGDALCFRYSNQLMQPLDPEDARYDIWLDAYLHLTGLLTDSARQRRFRLGAGDALFVHGHRVLHGRTAFVADGRRHLQDCYFDFDDVLANVDRLAGRAVAKAVV